MSFSDLMSSARGPGVIGTVLALIVLIGFGLLFMYSFDEGMKPPEQTLAGFIKEQKREIDSLAGRAARMNEKLENRKNLLALMDDLEATNSTRKQHLATIQWLENRTTQTREEIQAIGLEFETFKDRYRSQIRASAKGQSIGDLTTLKGQNFSQVSIREVTPVGIQIAHQNGFTRIPYEELPLEMQDLYQFCPQQKIAAMEQEQEVRRQHDRDVLATEQLAAERRKQQEAEQRRQQSAENLRLQIAAETRIEKLKEEIKHMQEAILHEHKKNISRAPQMRQQLDAMKRELARLQAAARQYRNSR